MKFISAPVLSFLTNLAVAPALLTTTPGGLIFTGHTSVLEGECTANLGEWTRRTKKVIPTAESS